ncbi:hypothetical protein EH165_02415 [Nakamurella antarctica]|uniref:Uncharacterized protein n=1 Tax=Nakamurella antarctica TaxID=1902245 RepID=A0A3G8ZJ06_9ACTN|nr:hypothetical protein [Nakamurella antarctica]AZI57178.1 hypothetical protein EH165_02415 [Nakamurella antarctica]
MTTSQTLTVRELDLLLAPKIEESHQTFFGSVTVRYLYPDPNSLIYGPNADSENAADQPASKLIEDRSNMWRQGEKFRHEHLDGRPMDVSDGQFRWQFHHEKTDFAFIDEKELTAIRSVCKPQSSRPSYFGLPPRPDHIGQGGPLQPLGPIRATDVNGRAAWEYTLPRSSHDRRPGPIYVIDAKTGYLIHSRYGDENSPPGYEWTEVSTGVKIPATAFIWEGPYRTLDEAVALNRAAKSKQPNS